jgi:branched-chain amino acid transport system permease protein
VIVLHEFYQRTITGKALRACAHNPVASSLMGINVQRMVLLTFALSGGLGALAGIIITPIIFSNYQIGTLIGLKGFCSAILGGIGSIYGAVLGGLLIGILESLFGTHVSSGYMDAFAFVVMLLVLLIRPAGLIGQAHLDRA